MVIEMSVQESFENLISLAIEKEEEAHAFYTEAAEEASLKSSAKLLRELANQELGHKEKLQKAFEEGVCESFTCSTVEEVKDQGLGEYLVDIPLRPSSSPQDILVVAIKREEAAHDFYQRLSELTGNQHHRFVFETLAKEEKKHKERLERMYDDAFQPWN